MSRAGSRETSHGRKKSMYPFDKYLPSTYYGPGNVLGAEVLVVNKSAHVPVLSLLTF